MKKLSVDNLGFTETRAAGEMIYHAVCFPEYVSKSHDGQQMIKPLFTASIAPKSGTDYSLTGQELLISLCNLYLNLNSESSNESITDAMLNWCRHNIHPYDIEALCEVLECNHYTVITMYDLIEQGRTFEMYYALWKLKYCHDADCAMHLYHEGRLCDGLSFLEHYRVYYKSTENLSHNVLADYDVLMSQLLDLFLDFRMRLNVDKKAIK